MYNSQKIKYFFNLLKKNIGLTVSNNLQQGVTYVGHVSVAISNIREGKMKCWRLNLIRQATSQHEKSSCNKNIKYQHKSL